MVGEIYDKDDENDFVFAEDSITFQEDGTFLICGNFNLEDIDAILGLSLDEGEVSASAPVKSPTSVILL